jgi:hypothetical protein
MERIRDECRMREEMRRENGLTSSRSLFWTFRPGCLRNFVSSKFRIFRMFFLFRILFESGNNFAKIIEIGGSFWGHGGSSWGRVGSSWGRVGSPWGHGGSSWTHEGLSLSRDASPWSLGGSPWGHGGSSWARGVHPGAMGIIFGRAGSP